MNEAASHQQSPGYHVILLVEEQAIRLFSYSQQDRERMLGDIREAKRVNPNSRVQAFVFFGKRLVTTKGEYPFLLEELHSPEPLFAVPRIAEASDTGDIGAADEEVKPSSQYNEATAAAAAETAQQLTPPASSVGGLPAVANDDMPLREDEV